MKKEKVNYNSATKLLETQVHKYELQNVKEPQLYRGIFDFDSIPKVVFNQRVVPMQTPNEWWITDTTFRDGQQSTAPFTVEQIVSIYKMLSRLGGPNGMIRQCEFFPYTAKDKSALRQCMDLGYTFPEITTWIRANEKDFDIIKEMNIKETGILVSCSDYHIFNKMGLDRQQALDKYLGIVKSALSKGIKPRCHFEDITRADYFGFVIPFATELMKLAKESKIPIKIRACDTLGFGVSYQGAALPRSVQSIIYGLGHYAAVPPAQLEWHGHNDFYKVVTNATTAWLYGCSGINCSVLGIGERTGNCPTEAMCIEYAQMRGTTNGMDLSVITELGDYFEREIDYTIPPRTPFVGRSFNATRAGIHADGLLKDEEIYNIFDTEKILGRKPIVSISNTSGLAGIAYWMNSFYELSEKNCIDKNDKLVVAVKEMVDAEYNNGRNTVMGDFELDNMIRLVDHRRHKFLETRESSI